MKKILLSSIILLIFSLSIFVFELSCRKTVNAQNSEAQSSSNKILISKGIVVQIGSTTTIDSLGNRNSTPVYRYSAEFYLMNYDGSNLSKINISMPQGISLTTSGKISPDGEKIIFQTNSDETNSIYSCYLDGSGLTKLIDGDYSLQDVR